MANPYWKGGAPAVQQEVRYTPANVNIGNTFTVTITAEDNATTATVQFVATVATVANVTAGLVAAAAASTDPLVQAITWSDQTTYVKALAGTSGVPIYSNSSATGGTATLVKSTPTPSAGPNDWNTAGNWSLGAVPVSTDDVTADGRGSAYAILYGLYQGGVTLTKLNHYVGAPAIGTAAYALQISATTAWLNLRPPVGGGATGALVNINFGNNAVDCTDYGSTYAGTGGLPGTLVTGNHASNAFTKLGGALAGIGLLVPNQTAQFPTITVANGELVTGTGTTWTTAIISNGTVTFNKAGGTTLTVYGGTVTVNGTTAITTCNANGGRAILNNRATAVTTLNMNGGLVDFSANPAGVTITTTNINDGGGGFVFAYPTQPTFTNKWANGLSTKRAITFAAA